MRLFAQMKETSAAQGLRECNKCGACCKVAPCLLMPEDVRRIADHLGESRKEFARHLQVERTPDNQWQVRMKSPCDFLSDNLCRIHEAKPRPAREFKCWTSDYRRYLWSKADLRLVGFSPEAVGK